MIRSLLVLLAAATAALAASDPVRPDELIDGFEGAFGVHAGVRRTHAKGVCARGSFTPTTEIRSLSRSPLFSSGVVEVLARFSSSGGNPHASDATRSARGMALQFKLPNGSMHQMAMLSTPVFAAATPESFLGLLRAQAIDPATGQRDPARVAAYIEKHRDTQPQARWLSEHAPPASYAATRYFSIHSFKFVDPAGQERYVRWSFDPHAGVQTLSSEQMKTAGASFLRDELDARLKRGVASWTLRVQLAKPSDAILDPTIQWTGERTEVIAGTLTISSVDHTGGCDQVNFDPLVLSEGVAPSDDPILKLRSPAYAISFGRRISEQVGAAE